MCKILTYSQRRFGAWLQLNCNANQVLELIRLIDTEYDYRLFACHRLQSHSNFVFIQVFTLFIENYMTDSVARLSSVTMLNYFFIYLPTWGCVTAMTVTHITNFIQKFIFTTVNGLGGGRVRLQRLANCLASMLQRTSYTSY